MDFYIELSTLECFEGYKHDCFQRYSKKAMWKINKNNLKETILSKLWDAKD